MLRAIEIENYRGIRHGKVEGFERVNLLVGPNGSGKSTLLESILVSRFTSGNEPGKTLISRRHNEAAFPSQECVWGKSVPGKVAIVASLDGALRKAEFSVGHGGTVTYPSLQVDQGSDLYFSALRFLDVHVLLDKNMERESWDELLNVRGDRILVSAFQAIFGIPVESFTYSGNSQNLKVLARDRDYALNIDDLGAGMRIAFRLLVGVILSRHGAVLAEEIDGFQGVESFPPLVATLFQLAEELDVQFFFSTHRLDTVRSFIETAEKRPEAALRVFQTRLNPDGHFEAAGIDAPNARTLLDGGFDLRRVG